MKEGVITNRLDLLIRLQDTTTGLPVGERSVRFYMNGKEIHPGSRGNGNFILINFGRENGSMRIDVHGYERYDTQIDYEQLDERLPSVDVFLIPSEKIYHSQEMLTLSGRLKGLSSIEAIYLARPLSGLREFDPKKCVMSVYMPNRRMNMVHTYYGLVNTAEQYYENFVVLQELSDKKLQIKESLHGEFPQNSPICRVIFGQVKKDGSYLLRMQSEMGTPKYMVKYVVDGETKFKTVDFSEGRKIALEEMEEL